MAKRKIVDASQKSKAQISIDQSAAELRLLLQETEEKILVVNDQLKIEMFNDKFGTEYQKLLGKKVQVGDSVLSYTIQKNNARLREIYRRVFSGETIESEIEVPVPNGEVLYYLNKYKPVIDENGLVVRAFVLSRNITFERRAKAEIQSERERLQKIMDQSLDLICTSEEGIFTSVNAAVQEILGFKPEEVIGQSYAELVHPDDIDRTTSVTEEIVSGKSSNNFENRFRHKRGHWVPIIWSARWDSSENVVYAIGRDATQQKKSEQSLKQNETRLSNAQKMANIGHWECSLNKRKMLWSEVVYRIFDWDPATVNPMYSNIVAAIHPEDLSDFKQQFNAAISGNTSMDIQHRIILSDQSVKYLHQRASLAEVSDGRMALQGTIHDVTEAKKQVIEQDLVAKVVKALHKHDELKDSLTEVLYLLTEFTGNVAGEAWYVSRSGKNLHRKAAWASPSKYQKISRNAVDVFATGEGLPGVTARSGKIEYWDKLEKRKRFQRREIVEELCVNHGIGIPIILKEETIAVFTLFNTGPTLDWAFVSEVLNRIALQIGIDIERKQATDELNQFFNFSPELICIVGKDGFYRRVNPAFYRLLGFSEKELLARPFHMFVHPEDREKSVSKLKENETGHITHQFENRYITKKGEVKWLLWHSSEQLDEEGYIYGFGADITALKEANEELVQYKHIIEHSRDGIGIVNLKNDGVYVNDGFQSVIGFSGEEIKAMGGPAKLFANYQRGQQMMTRIGSGEFWKGDIQLKTKSGEIVDYHLSAGPVFDDSGQLIALYGIHTDIRDRKRYEVQLQAAFAEKNRILESIGDGFLSMNVQQEITYWNGEAERITGLTRVETVGKNINVLFPENSITNIGEAFLEALSSRENITTESYSNVLNSWIQFTTYPTKLGTSVFFRDITASKEAEAEKDRLVEVIDRSLNEVYLFSQEDLTFQYVNSSALKNLGYSTEEMNEMTPLDVKPAYDHDAFMELVEPLITGEKDKIIFETEHLRADRSLYPVEVHLQINHHPRKPLFVAVILDITERLNQKTALINLNRQLGQRAHELAVSNAELEQFAYIASHDLQEPLRMVTSFLTRLEEKYSDRLDDKAHQYIGFATDGARRMRTIILDLLEFSKVDKGEDDFRKVDLNKVMESVVRNCEESISEVAGKITWEKLPKVIGLATPLERVFQNMVANAIKYRSTERNLRIKITAKSANNYWKICVQDNGMGIEERYYEKIFLIFQRLHQRDAYPGSGIGLAICKKIIDRHGGKIWVTSKPDSGSKFYFSIPKYHTA